MANNPYVNKVVYGNRTVMDISDTTAEESDVASGKTFYKGSGAKGVGTAVTPDISNCYQSTDSQETDIQDADYFPFYDSSATAKKNTLWSNIKAKLKNYFDTLYATYLGVSGLIETTVGWSTKNILNCDIASGTQTINGLTVNVSRTTGGDLIYIKVSGTATATTDIEVASSVSDNEYGELSGNTYILNGCPSGGSSTTYSLLLRGSYGSGAQDTGSGALISGTVVSGKVYIRIYNGYTASNLQFTPMIRNKNVSDATYEPYHESVEEVVGDIRAEQRVLGAKNILPYPYKDSTKTSATGVTFTVNSDDTITIDTGGSASTGTADFKLFGAWASISEVLPSGEYIASIGNINTNITLIAVYNNITLASGTDDLSVSAPNGISYLMVRVASGVTINNVTIKPMLRLASDPDDTYVPYAMTNRELTEKVHTMLPTPSASLTENDVVTAINAALFEGGVNDDVPSNFGVGKWSNTMSKAFLVQGVSGSSTPVGTSGVGTWPADPQNPTSAEKADWMCIPELYGCGSALGINFDLVYDPATVSVPIARGGYVIDDNETMSDGQGGTIPCAKMCIKFANEIPEADTHTAVVGAEITIKRTETVFVG